MKNLILTKLISCSLLTAVASGMQIEEPAGMPVENVPATPTTQALPVKEKIIYCHPELAKYLHAIEALEEGKQLISKILDEGHIAIQLADNHVTDQFAACWANEQRAILIGLSASRSEGEVLSSLIFELHNALMTSRLDELDAQALQGKIGKEEYVRAVELIEYNNSIAASHLARAGVQRGLFPRNTHLHVYNNFDEYYYYQKLSGHSAIIAENYNQLLKSKHASRQPG